MSIHQISKDRLFKITNSEQTLKPGQIVQGKILKLYRNNKAQIQIGSKAMVAKLEASLSIGEMYHFQVQTTDKVIHLKVLGEELQFQDRTDVSNLLRHLDLKSTNRSVDFVQMVITEKIPFEKESLNQVFQLLGKEKNNSVAQYVLKEMLAKKLPITEPIFQALFTKHTKTLSSQMKALLQQLRQEKSPSPITQKLMDGLSRILENPPDSKSQLIKQIITDVKNNKRQFFNLLLTSGIINEKTEFSTWKSQWQLFSNQQNGTPQTISSQQLANLDVPFAISEGTVQRIFKHMLANQTKIQQASQNMTRQWAAPINEAMIKNSRLHHETYTQFKQEITQKIMPLLTDSQQQLITNTLENNPSQLRHQLTFLQLLASEQIYMGIENFFENLTKQQGLSVSPQSLFLGQIKEMLLYSGLTYENLLTKDIAQEQSNVIKSMLIQMVQQTDGTINNRAQQLLHFINGLQLQSVNESGNFIEARLQIPAEKISLNSDLYIDFESKKNDEGKINPDYCRILFYLDLTNLRETIIDMHIQKRFVSLTIFNDQENIKKGANFLQPILKEGLESLNYQLTTVSFKPLQQKGDLSQRTSSESHQSFYEGIEFRI